jgi:hypothetical protein
MSERPAMTAHGKDGRPDEPHRGEEAQPRREVFHRSGLRMRSFRWQHDRCFRWQQVRIPCPQ